MIQMQELKREVCQERVENLIKELKTNDMLSDEVQEEIDALLEEGRYTKAGRLAVDSRSQKQTFAY